MTAPTPAAPPALAAESPFPWSKVQHIPGTSVVNGGTLLLDAKGAAMGLVVVIDCEKGDVVRPAITRALNTAGNVGKTLRVLDCARREGAEALAQVETLTVDRDQWCEAHTREYQARIATEMEQSAAVSARAAAEAALVRANAQATVLTEAHAAASAMNRSAWSIAERNGADTNWAAFRTQLMHALETSHEALNLLNPRATMEKKS